MILDYQLRLRDGGTTVLLTTAEAGTTTTLSRVELTGQAVIDLKKTPRLRGMAVVVTNTAGVLNTTGDDTIVTIEASDAEDFDTGDELVVATFPAFPETGSSKVIAANVAVRRFHTQMRYLRSVITLGNTPLDTGMTIGIFIADMIEEEV